jgi:hypothetical protein
VFGCLPEVLIGVLVWIVARGVVAGLDSFFGVSHLMYEVVVFVAVLYALRLAFHWLDSRIKTRP